MALTALALQAAGILDAAVQSEHGIVVEVQCDGAIANPALRAKQTLYRFRAELGDPAYMGLQIRISPERPDNELWLLKRTADATSAERQIEAENVLSLDEI